MTEKEYTPGEPKLYVYKLAFDVTGIVDSDAPEDYTKKVLLESLKETYPDGIELADFREATPEEAETFRAIYEVSDSETTIN